MSERAATYDAGGFDEDAPPPRRAARGDDPPVLGRIEEKLDRALAGRQLETLTTQQVMNVLQIGRTKLNELVQSGELQMWKLGGERRITRAGLEAFIRSKARE